MLNVWGQPEFFAGNPRRTARLAAGLLLAVDLGLLARALQTCATRPFRIDEFNYAHMGWQAWRLGLDAFPTETWALPIMSLLLAPIAGLAEPNPAHMLYMRGLMATALVVTVGCIGYVGYRRVGRARWLAALAGPLCLLAVPALVQRLAEIRPDGIAFTFTCLALAVLHVPVGRRRGAWRATAIPLVAGLCLGLAVLTSLKVVVYGGVFAVAFAADVTVNRRAPARRKMLRGPWLFALGFWLPIVGVVALALARGVWDAFWYILAIRPAEQQRFVDAVSPWHFGGIHLTDYPELWALALGGCVMALASVTSGWRRRHRIGRDLLIPMLCVSAWVSVILNAAPFEYSFIPTLGFAALAAGVALHWLARHGLDALHRLGDGDAARLDWRTGVLAFALLIWPLRLGYRAAWAGDWWLAAPFGCVIVAAFWPARSVAQRLSRCRLGAAALACAVATAVWLFIALAPPQSNARQLAQLQRIDDLTDPDDVAWDTTGSYVFRPRAHEFVFLTGDRWNQFREELPTTVPRAILDRGAVLWIYDGNLEARDFDRRLLPWLHGHYVQADGDLFVWGRRWTDNDRPWTETFHAIRDDAYFIWPADAARSAGLRIDGRPVTERIVHLKRGPHTVTWDGGPDAPPVIALVWLPADDKPFEPGDGSRLAQELGWY